MKETRSSLFMLKLSLGSKNSILGSLDFSESLLALWQLTSEQRSLMRTAWTSWVDFHYSRSFLLVESLCCLVWLCYVKGSHVTCLCFENARTTVIYLNLPPVIAGKGQKGLWHCKKWRLTRLCRVYKVRRCDFRDEFWTDMCKFIWRD